MDQRGEGCLLPDDIIRKIIILDGTELALTCKSYYQFLTTEILNNNINNNNDCDYLRNGTMLVCSLFNCSDIILGTVMNFYYRKNIIYHIHYNKYNKCNIIKIDPKTGICISTSNTIIFKSNYTLDELLQTIYKNSIVTINIFHNKDKFKIGYRTDTEEYKFCTKNPQLLKKIHTNLIENIDFKSLIEYVCDLQNWNLADFLDQKIINMIRELV